MDGKVNTWNDRSYAPKNKPPANFNFKRNCNPEKVTVWAGLFEGCQIVRPYFFEGNVNGNSYLAMLKGIQQYIFLLFHLEELLKLYVNLFYRFCVTLLYLEIFEQKKSQIS